jgi:hypothetical protein
LITILRWLGMVLGVVILALACVAIVARLSDGPIGPFAGGALQAGELVASEGVDWSFASELQTIEFQLLEPPRSRTVWVVYEDGALFIPCGNPNFRLWKQWPHEALEDGRAMLRIEGRRYAVSIERVEDPGLSARVLRRVAEKYDVRPGADARGVWVFRISPRSG